MVLQTGEHFFGRFPKSSPRGIEPRLQGLGRLGRGHLVQPRKSHNGFPNHLLRRDIQLIENFTPRKQWQLPIQILRKVCRQKTSTRCPRRGIGGIFGKDQLVGHGCSVGLRHQSRPCFHQHSMPHGPQQVSDRANRPMLQPNLTLKSIGQSDTGFRNPRP